MATKAQFVATLSRHIPELQLAKHNEWSEWAGHLHNAFTALTDQGFTESQAMTILSTVIRVVNDKGGVE